jgi:hypothetical protein
MIRIKELGIHCCFMIQPLLEWVHENLWFERGEVLYPTRAIIFNNSCSIKSWMPNMPVKKYLVHNLTDVLEKFLLSTLIY